MDDALKIGIVVTPSSGIKADIAIRKIPAKLNTVHVAQDAALSERTSEILAEAAALNDVVICDFGHSHQALSALSGSSGLLAGAHPGLRVIDFSLISANELISAAENFRQHGATLLGAGWGLPTPGQPDCYRCVYADSDTLASPGIGPILEQMASTVHRVGTQGACKSMAIIERLMTTVTMITSAEAIALGEKAGVSATTLTPLLLKGSGGNEVLRSQLQQDDMQIELRTNFDLSNRLADQCHHSLFFGSIYAAVTRGTPKAACSDAMPFSEIRNFFGANT